MSESEGLQNRRPWRAIAAMTTHRVIGQGNTIPWHYPEDFKWFKKNTLGATLVMGRKTYESIGRPLPKRTTVVLSRTAQTSDFAEGVLVVRSLDEVEALNTPGPIWLAGGAEVYKLGLSRCEDLLLTIIDDPAEGDAFFPEPTEIFPNKECLSSSGPLTFWRYSH